MGKAAGIWVLCCTTLASAVSGCSDRTISEVELPQAIERYVAPFVANGDFSGVVAVARKGQLIATLSAGFADFETRQKATLKDPFPIASLTKTFTAEAIRQLDEEGVLRLNDPLERFVPSFPNGTRITIQHLLAHQSGVADYWSLEGARQIGSRPVALPRLIKWLAEQPLRFEPGSDAEYSNSGYALLAAVITSATGREFHDYVADSIIARASMESTAPIGTSRTPVVGYQPAANQTKIRRTKLQRADFLIGAGSLQASAADLLKWCQHFNAGFNDPDSPPFIYGWGAREGSGRRWAEQSGRTDGFAAHLRAYPDEQLCVVVLSNIESEAVNAIGSAVGALAGGQWQVPPALRDAYELTSSPESYAGLFGRPSEQLVEVGIVDGELHLRGRNGPFLPLEPIGPDRFFYRQLFVEVHAERNSKEEVSALLWGGSYRMPRLVL